MANLGIKVEDVLKKFYEVQPDGRIKGLYAIREKGQPEGKLLWYVFGSNNATYHSSGNDCVIRDINQSNSGYLGRLKAAFEKARQEERKIFWLVLVYGDGIGLPPSGYDWMASVELRVNLDRITASLSMRNYPVGKGRPGYFGPGCVRIDQDRYFSTTFISCKDETGEFTSQYMDPYFRIYDNRPYHDIVEVVVEVEEEAWEQDTDTEGSPAEAVPRLTGAENILLYGVPGAGKSHLIKAKYCDDAAYMERVVFHPEYTYSDFVGQILPQVEKVQGEETEERLRYRFTPGPFTRVLQKAWKDPGHYYYLVIEELNRGNAPAIFGEMFQLLDRKREEEDYPEEELGESTYGISSYDVAGEVYGDGTRQVRILSNLYVLATMNTADQNVFTMDTAFQRRWAMKPVRNDIAGARHADSRIEGSEVTWLAFASVINDLVLDANEQMISSEDKRLGAYFASPGELSVDRFPGKVLKYLWDDAFKMDRDILFGSRYKSLEDVITAYEEAPGDRLEAVLAEQVYRKMYSFRRGQ